MGNLLYKQCRFYNMIHLFQMLATLFYILALVAICIVLSLPYNIYYTCMIIYRNNNDLPRLNNYYLNPIYLYCNCFVLIYLPIDKIAFICSPFYIFLLFQLIFPNPIYNHMLDNLQILMLLFLHLFLL